MSIRLCQLIKIIIYPAVRRYIRKRVLSRLVSTKATPFGWQKSVTACVACVLKASKPQSLKDVSGSSVSLVRSISLPMQAYCLLSAALAIDPRNRGNSLPYLDFNSRVQSSAFEGKQVVRQLKCQRHKNQGSWISETIEGFEALQWSRLKQQ